MQVQVQKWVRLNASDPKGTLIERAPFGNNMATTN